MSPKITTVFQIMREKSGALSLCAGVFDLLHMGHVRHLQEAASVGPLAVLVTPDKYVNKSGRPIVGEMDRMEMLAALECVSYVMLNLWPTPTEAISLLRPGWYWKGPDYRDELENLPEYKAHTGYTAFKFTTAPKLSTTEVIDAIRKA